MSKKKKNNKDIDKYVKWMNIISIVLIFGLNILVFLIEFFDIFPIFDKFPALMLMLPITTLMGLLILVWVRKNKSEDRLSKNIVNFFIIIGIAIVLFLIFPYILFIPILNPAIIPIVLFLVGIVIFVRKIVNKPKDVNSKSNAQENGCLIAVILVFLLSCFWMITVNQIKSGINEIIEGCNK